MMTVDDDREVLRAIEPDLRRKYGEHYRVLKADSGQSALDTLRELKTSMRIVRKHHGNLRLETRPGDTCFQVRLPLMQNGDSSAKVLATDDRGLKAVVRSVREMRR